MLTHNSCTVFFDGHISEMQLLFLFFFGFCCLGNCVIEIYDLETVWRVFLVFVDDKPISIIFVVSFFLHFYPKHNKFHGMCIYAGYKFAGKHHQAHSWKKRHLSCPLDWVMKNFNCDLNRIVIVIVFEIFSPYFFFDFLFFFAGKWPSSNAFLFIWNEGEKKREKILGSLNNML